MEGDRKGGRKGEKIGKSVPLLFAAMRIRLCLQLKKYSDKQAGIYESSTPAREHTVNISSGSYEASSLPFQKPQ